jgi:signal transduction histidine kinase
MVKKAFTRTYRGHKEVTSTSRPVWYRSLYWRIAFGFIALLAVLLLAQGLVFLWLTDRIVGPSSRSPTQLAETVAAEISRDLTEQPDIPLDAYVHRKFGHIYQPFLVLMNDGRRASNRPNALPPDLVRAALRRRRPAPTDEPDLRGGGRRPPEVAPIVIGDSQAGSVIVPSEPPPFSIALRELGPVLAWFALGLLGMGATVTALLIFRPAHNRLRALEQAATALGQGQTYVRAAESGGDEVSSLARTFNRMAVDLEARAAALAESDRGRRQLLADVSHELMTPLSAIRGYTETLAMPELTPDEPTRQRYLGIIAEETGKLEELIGDLLDLARLEGGGGTLAFKAVRVSDLFARVVDRHGPVVREKGISIAASVRPEDLSAWGDAQRLEQALQNLAANAVRHTPARGRLELRAERIDNATRIIVRDTGPGIPVEHLPRVFDRFYKVDASRSVAGTHAGSGLGLSIVRAILERHGGGVTASNAPGGGAMFELTLPSAGEGSGRQSPRDKAEGKGKTQGPD